MVTGRMLTEQDLPAEGGVASYTAERNGAGR
jgi:hypothetical protein